MHPKTILGLFSYILNSFCHTIICSYYVMLITVYLTEVNMYTGHYLMEDNMYTGHYLTDVNRYTRHYLSGTNRYTRCRIIIYNCMYCHKYCHYCDYDCHHYVRNKQSQFLHWN